MLVELLSAQRSIRLLAHHEGQSFRVLYKAKPSVQPETLTDHILYHQSKQAERLLKYTSNDKTIPEEFRKTPLITVIHLLISWN